MVSTVTTTVVEVVPVASRVYTLTASPTVVVTSVVTTTVTVTVTITMTMTVVTTVTVREPETEIEDEGGPRPETGSQAIVEAGSTSRAVVRGSARVTGKLEIRAGIGTEVDVGVDVGSLGEGSGEP